MAANPSASGSSLSNIHASTWPENWLLRYTENEYHKVDPIVHCALIKERPFLWSVAKQRGVEVKRVQNFYYEAHSVGLVDGICFPFHSKNLGHSLMSLASSYCRPVDETQTSLLYLAAAYFNATISENCDAHAPSVHLTEREREVLRWTAAGKTAWETSEILAISERTVQGHLAAVRQKLDVATTTQAVARACRFGYINM
ncbi:helix-turn-helix transcriptional regulator [Limoniibacter endophyticus]|nr:LuxR family transcriptional regulator [Limoniibacter endophyticus]